MSKLLHFQIKLCRCKVLGNPYSPNLLLKKYVYFTLPSVNYVNKSDTKSTTVNLVEDVTSKIFPEKPKVIPAWRPTPSTDKTNLIQHYLKLSKIRLTTLVVVTSMAGYAVAPAPFVWDTFALCVMGTGLLSSAANAVNQFHEVPFDAQMSRTKHRVLVCGRLTPLHSMLFAATTSLGGLAILNFGVNGLTAALGLANFILYTSIYTPMKRISILNTWVGSIVGAIPPLMGWAACANSLGPGAWLMAALLYSWQFPHFNALSWNLRPDYSRAGYRMMAVTDPGLCRRVALRHTVAIEAMTIAAPFLDVTNWYDSYTGVPETALQPLTVDSTRFLKENLIRYLKANVSFIFEAVSRLEKMKRNNKFPIYYIHEHNLLTYNFYQDSSSQTSRKLFRFSLLHLPLLMVLFLINKKKWFVFDDDVSRLENIEQSVT